MNSPSPFPKTVADLSDADLLLIEMKRPKLRAKVRREWNRRKQERILEMVYSTNRNRAVGQDR